MNDMAERVAAFRLDQPVDVGLQSAPRRHDEMMNLAAFRLDFELGESSDGRHMVAERLHNFELGLVLIHGHFRDFDVGVFTAGHDQVLAAHQPDCKDGKYFSSME